MAEKEKKRRRQQIARIRRRSVGGAIKTKTVHAGGRKNLEETRTKPAEERDRVRGKKGAFIRELCSEDALPALGRAIVACGRLSLGMLDAAHSESVLRDMAPFAGCSSSFGGHSHLREARAAHRGSGQAVSRPHLSRTPSTDREGGMGLTGA